MNEHAEFGVAVPGGGFMGVTVRNRVRYYINSSQFPSHRVFAAVLPCTSEFQSTKKDRSIAILISLVDGLLHRLHGSRIEFHNTLGGFWGRIVGWWFRATGVSVSS